jgi:CDGSH-type Zn-finger protein
MRNLLGIPLASVHPRGSSVDDDATITPYCDGPYIIRGNFRITDQDGNPIEPGRKTIALCRCGKSQIRPFCDGTHKLIGFRAAGGAEGERGLPRSLWEPPEGV